MDLALAALVGTSAITGIAAWNPRVGDAASHQLRLQSQLRDTILNLLEQRGVLWLIGSPPGTACSYLVSRSNSSFGLAATFGSLTCGSPPKRGSTAASLTMRLVPYQVTLAAWSLA